uniref:Uncharacterized protein n=1 Tax=Lepeophtheirus salmonis TaxID=72036 RepID=A0A0K2TCX7_LEPSM
MRLTLSFPVTTKMRND